MKLRGRERDSEREREREKNCINKVRRKLLLERSKCNNMKLLHPRTEMWVQVHTNFLPTFFPSHLVPLMRTFRRKLREIEK